MRYISLIFAHVVARVWSALTGSDAILAWVSSDVIGQIVSFVLALLGCSFARCYKMIVGLFGA